MTRVAVIQSNYLPWKGYFDIIHDVDCFVFYDDTQFTKNDWRNRNLIKTPSGTSWLTIPVGTATNRLIREVAIVDQRWSTKHWKSIRQYYSRAPHFGAYGPFFEHALLERSWQNLSELNQFLVISIAKNFLGITTEFRDSVEFQAQGNKADRLLDLLRRAGAETYVSGPSARDYIDASRFAEAGVRLVYKSYAGYPEYPQAYPPFTHAVSIVDLLFNVGPDAPWHIWGWRDDPRSGPGEN